MLQAMLSGHSGSLTTVHANSTRDALVRLETLSMMSDVEIPVHVARAQVGSAIDLIVQLDRYSEDGSRKISRITEVMGVGIDGNYETRDVFECHLTGKAKDGRLIANLAFTGHAPTFANEPKQHGMYDRIKFSKKVWGLLRQARQIRERSHECSHDRLISPTVGRKQLARKPD